MHLGMQYSEVKRLPVRYRQWFVKRLVEHFKKMNAKKQPDDQPIDFNKFNEFNDAIKKKMS